MVMFNLKRRLSNLSNHNRRGGGDKEQSSSNIDKNKEKATNSTTSPPTAQEESTLESPTSSKRKVKFDESKNKLCDTVHLNDMSQEDKDTIWITPKEFMENKSQTTTILRLMMANSNRSIHEVDDICIRGLEFRTKEGSRRRKQTKKKATQTVLIEQQLQRDEGIQDSIWLSEVYREVSGASSIEALNRGLKDHAAMLECLDANVRIDYEQRRLFGLGTSSSRNKRVAGSILCHHHNHPTRQRRRSNITETFNAGGTNNNDVIPIKT